jgi:hypothetical protein
MRLLTVSLTILCLLWALVASAQTLEILGLGEESPESTPQTAWFGTTGLIMTPSAYIAPPMKLSAGWHRVELDDVNQDLANVSAAITADLEFGVARLSNILVPGIDADKYVKKTIVSAKYNLDLANWFGLAIAPEVAVGVRDISDEINRALYVVASKEFRIREKGTLSQFTLHLGWGNTKHNYGPLDGFFAGIEFVPYKNMLVQAEWDHERYNAALRYYVVPFCSVDIGVVDGDFAYGVTARSAF